MLRFQSTFPRGERRFLRGGSRLVSYFNPRSLVGNDVLRRAACPLLFYFNPRSLVGNDGNQNIRRNQNGNFNPRSLVGNDRILDSAQCATAISIHVPSWGTTEEHGVMFISIKISIHVPSWGTTMMISSSFAKLWYFNPRSLVGNDREPFFEGVLLHYFNPRSLVGNDGSSPSWMSPACIFQSTFPRGERRQIFTNILCFFMQ